MYIQVVCIDVSIIQYLSLSMVYVSIIIVFDPYTCCQYHNFSLLILILISLCECNVIYVVHLS